MSLHIALILFLLQIAIDGMYGYYVMQVNKNRPVPAATSGALIHFALAYGVFNYVRNFWYVFPIAAGSWIGTYLAIRYLDNK